MASRVELLTLLDYDLWANRQWLEVLSRFPYPEEPTAIFRHIIGSQKAWLRRTLGPDAPVKVPDDIALALKKSILLWKGAIRSLEPAKKIQYLTTEGDPFTSTVEEIVRHVANHGSYHRGQMRMVAENRGFLDFPETDLIRFYRE